MDLNFLDNYLYLKIIYAQAKIFFYKKFHKIEWWKRKKKPIILLMNMSRKFHLNLINWLFSKCKQPFKTKHLQLLGIKF